MRDDILAFIIKYKTQHDGQSPSFRQIMRACDVSSTSVVSHNLAGLQASGQIRMPNKREKRSIQVVGGAWSMGAR